MIDVWGGEAFPRLGVISLSLSCFSSFLGVLPFRILCVLTHAHTQKHTESYFSGSTSLFILAFHFSRHVRFPFSALPLFSSPQYGHFSPLISSNSLPFLRTSPHPAEKWSIQRKLFKNAGFPRLKSKTFIDNTDTVALPRMLEWCNCNLE